MNTFRLTYGKRRCQGNCFSYLINSLRWYSNKTEIAEQIQIPARIHRGPTDILRALSNTVQKDTTAAHYKYHDDPYLVPMSNVGKRTFAMAQESGRKSAHWIMQQHPDLFLQTLSDPPIKAYIPQQVFNESSEVNENILNDIIKDIRVNDAITVYNLLESKNVDISRATKQAFLELLCFYNSEEALSELLIEERWFKQGTQGGERRRKTWNDNGLAEKIFRSLEPADSASYCAIIQGMAKYCQVERAWQIYEESQAKNILLNTDTYNSLIQIVIFVKVADDKRWSVILELLTAMSKQRLKPNIGTLNSVLEVISQMSPNRINAKRITQVLSEFQNQGIQPSLASWYYILISLCKERGPVNGVLIDIMNQIEGKEFTIVDTKDTFFFVTAMDVCRNHLHDKDLAIRVDKLLHTGNNYDLIGDSYKESIYYRHYFGLMCNTEPLDKFMELYDKLVPNIYTPEPGIMFELLNVIHMNEAIELIPRIWSDMIIFDHTSRENLVSKVLTMMVTIPPPKDSNLNEQFMTIAWDVWTKTDEQFHQTRTNRMNLTGRMLTNILILCLRVNEFDKVNTILNMVDRNPNIVLGLIEYDGLKMYVDKCIERNEVSKTLNIVQYCVDSGYSEAGSLAKLIMDSFTLDEYQIDKLTNIVGKEVLQLTSEIINKD